MKVNQLVGITIGAAIGLCLLGSEDAFTQPQQPFSASRFLDLHDKQSPPISVFLVADPLMPVPGRKTESGPNIPLPQDHFDVTSVGPVEPIPKIALQGLSLASTGTDLVIRGLSFTPEGKVRYFVLNLSRQTAAPPFVVDLLYNGQRRDTVKHNGLPPLSQQRVESSLANPGGCAVAQLQAIADTQQTVAETNEANNAEVTSQVPPCPDLVVHIETEETDTLHYRAKIKVTNKGTRAAGRPFIVLLRETSGPAGYILVPPADKRIDDLQAGASTSFHYGGNHLKTSAVGYHAIVDRFDDIKESDETNNNVQKTLP